MLRLEIWWTIEFWRLEMEGVEVGMVISGDSERMRVPLGIKVRAMRPLPLLGMS